MTPRIRQKVIDVNPSQHFVPEVYLKYFAQPNRRIWRFNGKDSILQPIKRECTKSGHYDAVDPPYFQQLEDKYGDVMDKKIRKEKALTDRHPLVMTLMMFDLHCRNPAYDNLTGENNKSAHMRLLHCLYIFAGDGVAPLSQLEFSQLLKAHWDFRLLRTTDGLLLMTSDNPSLWFTHDENTVESRLHYMLLPILPSCCALAWDTRYSRLTSEALNRQDSIRLNVNQLQHCHRAVYDSSQPQSTDLSIYREAWKRRDTPLLC